MKFRTGFVTNSSSTSYGVVVAEGVAAATGACLAATLIHAIEQYAESLGGTLPQSDDADAGGRGSGGSECPIEQELEQARRDREQMLETLDPDQDGYEDMVQEWDDYIESLEQHIEWEQYEREMEEYQRIQEEYAEQRRIEQRQEDLRQVLEQQSFVEAGKEGYGQHSIDVSEYERQLNDLRRRENELRQQLAERDADIDYTPRERDPIGPSQEMMDRMEQAELERELEKQAEQDEARRERIKEEMEQAAREFEEASRSGRFWDALTRVAEFTKSAADLGIDVLATVTGPAGQKIKVAYGGIQGVAGGVGEAMADRENAVRHVLRGGLDGATSVVSDRLGDKKRYGRYAQGIFNVGSEAALGGVDAYLDGESVLEGVGSGAIQGGLGVVRSELGDYLIPDFDPDIDLSNMSLSDLPMGVIFEAGKHGLQSEGADLMIGFVQGEDVVFEGWNHGFMQ